MTQKHESCRDDTVTERSRHHTPVKRAIAWSRLVVLVLSVCSMVGCVTIKNTDGLYKCREEAARAELLTFELKRTLTPGSNSYSELLAGYSDAAASVNTYYQKIFDRLDVTDTLEATIEGYEKSTCASKLTKFNTEMEGQFAGHVFDPGTVSVAAFAAKELIDMLLQQRNKAIAEAKTKIKTTLDVHRMPPFSLLTEEYMTSRYQVVQEPPDSRGN